MQDAMVYTEQGSIEYVGCAAPDDLGTGDSFAEDYFPLTGDACSVDWSGEWYSHGSGGDVLCFGERYVRGFSPCPAPVSAYCQRLRYV